MLWIHQSVTGEARHQLLNDVPAHSLEANAIRERNLLVHFYKIALAYHVLPLKIEDDRLIIRNKEFFVFEDNSVRTSIEDEPLSDRQIIEWAETLQN